MPELPEVETIKRTLEQLVLHKTIEDVTINLARIVRSPEPDQFRALLKGKQILAIDRRGKYLLFRLSSHYTLISHLRMEGNYGVFNSMDAAATHTHVIFHFDDGEELRYRDTRQFGTMDLVKNQDVDQLKFFRNLGKEPFDLSLTEKLFYEKIKKKNKSIKAVLLDQEVVAGIGNIYADEILFRSRIRPEMLANNLTKPKIHAIYENMKIVLREAIEAGGSSVKSYVNGQGKMGLFQQQLYVYQKHGTPCLVCGDEIVKTRVAGRGTHYCPKCQKLR
ncbi:DNA-formamidopyrimidine glycosylase [Desulfuribacillus stibiiarsenatis]|uniref:Formamidopyrimidine-DNA glycosylase n=1 Tax=Desulfuribacillus stibiiarsenatis TaxID=1390249 RepID=A0A1E5L2V4_9FIRM|nr:DNA-formamidopyrimidine glycosylase [Desulfuribacillus stibiiarsenatis]OEH84452.1 DNA-formamidopyrimidine glycosylase [Desulfuribacillus stibiiarsenatis]